MIRPISAYVNHVITIITIKIAPSLFLVIIVYVSVYIAVIIDNHHIAGFPIHAIVPIVLLSNLEI